MKIYKVVYVDGNYRAAICLNNKPDKYGQPKIFTKEDAEKWIQRHTYKGMSFKYVIKEVDL